MIERYTSILKWAWLLISGICLTLPVFIPSYPSPGSPLPGDVMGAATGVMFMLSFPSSVLWAVALAFGRGPSGWHIYSIWDMYLSLFFLCVLGYIQWFYVLPRISKKKEPLLQVIDLHAGHAVLPLDEIRIDADFAFFDSNSKTPVERVIEES